MQHLGVGQNSSSAAHGSLPRQFGAGEAVVVTNHTILSTGHGFPLSWLGRKRQTSRLRIRLVA